MDFSRNSTESFQSIILSKIFVIIDNIKQKFLKS